MFSSYIFNKPFGTLSQFTKEIPEHQVLGDHFNFPKTVYPVGRLDRDSEGLLILTDDPSINSKLLDPKHKIPKEYWVQVEGIPSQEELKAFEKGIVIKTNKGPYTCLPASAEIIEEPEIIWERSVPIRYRKNKPTSWISIVIGEGKNRQVRKMCAKIGFPVLRLIRWRIGQMTLGELQPGEAKLIRSIT